MHKDFNNIIIENSDWTFHNNSKYIDSIIVISNLGKYIEECW